MPWQAQAAGQHLIYCRLQPGLHMIRALIIVIEKMDEDQRDFLVQMNFKGNEV